MFRYLAVMLFATLLGVAAGQNPELGGDTAKAVGSVNREALSLAVVDQSMGDNAGIFAGIGEFEPESNLARLTYPPDDAIALAHYFVVEVELIAGPRARLAIAGEPKTERTRMMLDELKRAGIIMVSPKKIGLEDAIEATIRAPQSTDSMVIIALSSHGFEERGEPFIMPSDGRESRVRSTGISLQFIEATLADKAVCVAGKRLLILDACRERPAGETKSGPAGMAAAFDELFKTTVGTAVLYSCKVGQQSWESNDFGHGIYTHFLLEGFRGGAGSGRFITVGDVSAFASQKTRQWVRSQRNAVQEPDYRGEDARMIPVALRRAAHEADEAMRGRVALARKQLNNAFLADGRIINGTLVDAAVREMENETSPHRAEIVSRLEKMNPEDAFHREAFANWMRALPPSEPIVVANAATRTPVPATPRPTNTPAPALEAVPVDPLGAAASAPGIREVAPALGVPGIKFSLPPGDDFSLAQARAGITFDFEATGEAYGVNFRWRVDDEAINEGRFGTANVKGLSPGVHTFQAQAFTRAGVSAPIVHQFTVRGNEPPTAIFVTAPATGSVVESASVRVRVGGTDTDGSVTRYVLVVNDPDDPDLRFVNTTGEFDVTHQLSESRHRLIAQVIDNEGAESAPISVDFSYRRPRGEAARPTPAPTPAATAAAAATAAEPNPFFGSSSNPFGALPSARLLAVPADERQLGQTQDINLGRGVTMRLVWVPHWSFLMGSPEDEPERDTDEGPQTEVRFTRGFWMGQTEVTVAQFRRFVDSTNYVTEAESGDGSRVWTGEEWKTVAGMTWKNPGFPQDDQHPVICVSWNDAQKFCQWLSTLSGLAIGLPTEAQWEYACRSGARTRFSFGDDEQQLARHAWFLDNADVATKPVAQLTPNRSGLYDMHGNVGEWCADWLALYPGGSVTDPVGAAAGTQRVYRGGTWYNKPKFLRSAFREAAAPDRRFSYVGIRVASTPPGPSAMAAPAAGSIAASGGATSAPPAASGSTGTRSLNLGGGVALEMAWIPAGAFRMGSPDDEVGRDTDEAPLTNVTISKGFWMARHEITVAQFRRFVDQTGYVTEAEAGDGSSVWNGSAWERMKDRNWRSPGYTISDSHPVTCITWNDARRFCDWATRVARLQVSLPTEAEWEYACRAGTTTPFSFGADESALGQYAWVMANSGLAPKAVGLLPANRHGLHDIHGNVWEWTLDWLGAYPGGTVTDPSGVASGTQRVIRGGGWNNDPKYVRSAFRNAQAPDGRFSYIGMRVIARDGAPGSTAAAAANVLPRTGAQGQRAALPLPGGGTLPLVWVPAGTVLVGSPDNEPGRDTDEGPITTVAISEGTWLGETEVTVGQFRQFVQATNYQTDAERTGGHGYVDSKWEQALRFTWRTPGYDQGDTHPVVNVSWNDCKAFCAWLGQSTDTEVDLPTEAEWEHACRAGSIAAYSWGADPAGGRGFANGADLTAERTNLDWLTFEWDDRHLYAAPVKSFTSNAYGLHDMHGNVWEWTSSWFGNYPGGRQTDYIGPATGTHRVSRGGSWLQGPRGLRSAFRLPNTPDTAYGNIGFRIKARARTGGTR